MPEVPDVFRWRVGDAEVIVHYSADYGTSLVLEDLGLAIEYAYTGDNTGPQNARQMDWIQEILEERYPGAEAVAATINDIAEILVSIKDTLPVVTEEIGDTWIHGVGTDPCKIRDYHELLRLKDLWIAQGRMKREGAVWHEFMTNLMLVAEHTWSVDIKKYLFDFTNWDKKAFQSARKKDKTDISMIPDQYDTLKRIVKHELDIFRNGCTEGAYSIYEAAQAEQLVYIENAVNALPEELHREAQEALSFTTPRKEDLRGELLSPNQFIELGGYCFKIDGTGALNYLKKGNRVLVEDGQIGSLSYQIYSAKTVIGLQYDHNVRLGQNLGWSEADYHKSGLCTVPGLKDRLYLFAVSSIWRERNRVIIRVNGDEDACERYGCPRSAELIYKFDEKVRLTVNWFDKDANRIPEAIWLGFRFNVAMSARWQMRKIDTWMSPLDVVRHGNRKQHVVPEWKYTGCDGGISLCSHYAGLCSVGARNLYTYDNKIDDLENGLFYCLFNNRWGTNFKTWCQDDVSLCFEMSFSD